MCPPLASSSRYWNISLGVHLFIGLSDLFVIRPPQKRFCIDREAGTKVSDPDLEWQK